MGRCPKPCQRDTVSLESHCFGICCMTAALPENHENTLKKIRNRCAMICNGALPQAPPKRHCLFGISLFWNLLYEYWQLSCITRKSRKYILLQILSALYVLRVQGGFFGYFLRRSTNTTAPTISRTPPRIAAGIHAEPRGLPSDMPEDASVVTSGTSVFSSCGSGWKSSPVASA